MTCTIQQIDTGGGVVGIGDQVTIDSHNAAMRWQWNKAVEECAKIAGSFKPGFCGDDKDSARWDLAEAIAADIRKLGRP